ncbi:hypothetical protein AX16_002118 [Volvariella volvacea WC 439]|nr:hypothetical protein AX16_002118 [Volvariella volvacea WC 439]
MMETAFAPRPGRGGRGGGAPHEAGFRRPQSRNKQWVAGDSATSRGGSANGHSDSERWERGGHRGGGRGLRGAHRGGRRFPNQTYRPSHQQQPQHVEPHESVEEHFEDERNEGTDMEEPVDEVVTEKEPETAEEFERFYQELVKAREIERKKAIAEGKMDDPAVPKRLEDAITMVGTCMDMCPRFERYRRQRENNLFEWETIPGSKRVDHKRAVKMYERAAGDKTLPSDLRPPPVLKRTLDYLFHDLLPRGGFSPTCPFIRDRSRAVRNDFTMQHETGQLAIECHDRCARFHILALHFERGKLGFSTALEEQQLMNTLQSLKEFYEDQRGRYQSPTELEMRVYHRLIHIRDQRERSDDIPPHILKDPVFELTTAFRLHVQKKSAPITKQSALVVDGEAMNIFGQLAGVLREKGNSGMIYLVACILEHLFGTETIDNIESIKGDLSIPDIIDGTSRIVQSQPLQADPTAEEVLGYDGGEEDEFMGDDDLDESFHEQPIDPAPSTSSSWAPSPFIVNAPAAQSVPAAKSAFANLASQSSTNSVFGGGTFNIAKPSSSSVFGTTPSVFGTSFGAPAPTSQPSGSAQPPPPAFSASAPPLQSQPQPQPQPFPSTTPRNPFQLSSTPTSTPNAVAQPQAKPLNAQAAPFIPGAASGSLSFPKPSKAPEAAAPPSSATLPTFSTSQQPRKTPSLPKIITNANETGGLLLSASAPASVPAPLTNGVASNTGLTRAPTIPNLQSEPSPVKEPPPLARFHPISLPSTPTGASFFPSTTTPALPTQSASKPTALQPQPSLMMDHVRKSLQLQSFTPSGSGIVGGELLSPLGIQSPMQQPQRQGSGYFGHNALSLQFAPPVPSPMKKRRDSENVEQGTGDAGNDEVENGLVVQDKGKGKQKEVVEEEGSRKEDVVAAVQDWHQKSISSALNTRTGVKEGRQRAFLTDDEGEDEEPTEEEIREMEAKAEKFERKSNVVKRCFKKWMEKATDAAAWKEAVKQSEQYKKKVLADAARQDGKKRRASGSLTEGRSSMREAIDEDAESFTSGRSKSPNASRKRARKRVSGVYQQPRTDEELAKRLRENHEEQERRWARGTFLQVIRDHVVAKSAPAPSSSVLYPSNAFPLSTSSAARGFTFTTPTNAGLSASTMSNPLSVSTNHAPTSHTSRTKFSQNSRSQLGRAWRLWLSMNPENDSTAIWLEKKFEVPSSGEWENEMVFGIPAFDDGGMKPKRKSPGLIFFERTPPADGAEDDELERKYRALDDCSRLRDIVKSFPEKRYFTPSLLVFQWLSQEKVKEKSVSVSDGDDEFLRMAKNLKDDGILLDYSVLSISSNTTNLDAKLQETLETLKVDVEGQLVQELSVKGVYKAFEAEYTTFVFEWLENCLVNGELDWILYGRFLQVMTKILRELGRIVLQLIEAPIADWMPIFEGGAQIQDEEGAYEQIESWLSSLDQTGAVEQLAQDLKSLHDMGKGMLPWPVD